MILGFSIFFIFYQLHVFSISTFFRNQITQKATEC